MPGKDSQTIASLRGIQPTGCTLISKEPGRISLLTYAISGHLLLGHPIGLQKQPIK